MTPKDEVLLYFEFVRFAAYAAIILAVCLLFYFVARRIGDWQRFRPWLAALVVGLPVGVGLAVFLLDPDLVMPATEIDLQLPPDFAYADVVLLEDPRAPGELVAAGWKVPFIPRKIRLEAPASGIMRVKSFKPVEDRPVTTLVNWGDEWNPVGFEIRNAPPELGAARAIMLNGPYAPGKASVTLYEDNANLALDEANKAMFVKEIQSREGK